MEATEDRAVLAGSGGYGGPDAFAPAPVALVAGALGELAVLNHKDISKASPEFASLATSALDLCRNRGYIVSTLPGDGLRASAKS